MKKLLCLVGLLLAPMAFAATAIDQLTILLENTKSVQADFIQTVYDDSGTALSKSEGNFILQRPNKFYWLITKPTKQEIINDGKKVWNYQPDLEQVVVTDVSHAIDVTPLAILSGSTTALKQNFTVTQENDNTFKLLAKRVTSFEYVWLYFSNGVISGMKLQDALGQSTQLKFSDVKTNVIASSDKFKFSPPKGVDVISSM